MTDLSRFVFKTETDGQAATRVLAITLLDIDTGKIYSFSDQPGGTPIADAVSVLPACDLLVSHSDYHVKVVEKLFGITIDRDRFLDTLVASRLLFPEVSKHSLGAWASRVKIARIPFRGADVWSKYVTEHCERDARIIARVYREIMTRV